MTIADPKERFWSQVTKTDGCWVWTGADHKGYGQFTLYGFKNDQGKWRSKTVRAHRQAYEWLVGPIPDGLTIDHECKNHACVRPGPKHCVPKTRGENSLLGDGPAAHNKRKTHCDKGHEFTEENTIRRPGRASRECRTCANASKREKYVPKPRQRADTCKEGHLFDEVTSQGKKSCSQCRKAYHREYMRNRRKQKRS